MMSFVARWLYIGLQSYYGGLMYGYYLIGSDLLVKKMAAVGTKTSKVRQSETLFITLSVSEGYNAHLSLNTQ